MKPEHLHRGLVAGFRDRTGLKEILISPNTDLNNTPHHTGPIASSINPHPRNLFLFFPFFFSNVTGNKLVQSSFI